jgi:chitosanase
VHTFLDLLTQAMEAEEAHSGASRIDTAQRIFLRNGNVDLCPPRQWRVYRDDYELTCR